MAKNPPIKVPGYHMSMSIRSPMDMFRKLQWESSLFETKLMDEMQAPVYCTFNAATTAWHMGDWTAAALDEHQGWQVASAYFQATVEKLGDLQSRMRTCHGILACQQVAAAAKHMTIEGRTYREGFKAYDHFSFFGRNDSGEIEWADIQRTIGVTFPNEIDNGVVRTQTHSVAALLGDAMMWWESTLRGLSMWSEDYQ